jgi:NAD(P)-dependent dehydrogenase (short-subunit alcohol dehydrogenase family)
MSTDRPQPTTLNKLFDLAGRVSLVTGARGLLGRSLATALAEAGSRVVVTSREAAAAEELARSLPNYERAGHLGLALDYLEPASIERGFAEACQRVGPIQVLVNNGHHPLAKDWRDVTAEEFNRQLSMATGYFLLARMLRDQAVERSVPASVVMLGSMYGLVGSYPDAYEGICAASPAAYHALKGGIVHLTRHLAVYWARDGVRVNCLSPGPFPGPQAPAAMVERLKTRSPLGRMGRPDELKGALVFLASDASSYVTGHNLVVDGGWTAW